MFYIPSTPNYITRFLAIVNNSQVMSIIIYPFKQFYINWKKFFYQEYTYRSLMRATSTTLGIVLGPILTQTVNFTWLYNISLALFNSIPGFNLLPVAVGTTICSAYICSYFFSWLVTQLTNIINSIQTGSLTPYLAGTIEHYLTLNQASMLSTQINALGYDITSNQVLEIFNNINLLHSREPNNELLSIMIKSLKNSDLQTILDNAFLLETFISIIEKKINILNQTHQQLNQVQITSSSELSGPPSSPANEINNREISLFNALPVAILHQYQRLNDPRDFTTIHHRNITDLTPLVIQETIVKLEHHKQQLEQYRFVPRNLLLPL